MIAQAIEFLSHLATILPLPFFVGVGSFLEELIAPIPSLVVTAAAGSLSAARDKGLMYLLFLSVIGGLGKTLAAYIVYALSDRAEDIITQRFGTILGIKHEDIENLGKRLSRGWRDDVIVFLLRAIPIGPTATVSFVCGVLNMNRTTFLIATFLGYTVRSFLLIKLGFEGLNLVLKPLGSFPTALISKLSLALILLLVVSALIYHKRFKKTKLSKSSEK